MDKKYAIFDMDGTLTDSMGYWRGLGVEFLRARGVDPIPYDVLGRLRHMTMVESGAILLECCHLEGTPQSVADELNDMMKRHYRTDVELKPGVLDYLRKLQDQGVQMYVASATINSLVELCLTRLGIRDFFQGTISCESVGVGKRAPDVYHAAARAMGAAPEECAVYEDSFQAGQTAKKAGYYLVGIYDETGKEEWPQMMELADELILDWTKV